ncbi:MAG TPA: SMI1/KNR4 family protein [Leptolyngbyaceae cyanobacterium M33_DOE_097]|uniref:SMI1/KNR4 family protein n=1 Tax=Oscillatoriales cyanobacterium SpSt-418 TaxID=2282169 RepID=A0A7C3PHD4_9CYAN|nr:SMI1/KNR4 family protein [Leptolyngbyaceae cyanobacterium M33_DOE_097]
MDIVEFQGISFLVAAPPLCPIPTQELVAVENQLGFLFPEDYRAFITTIGVGNAELGIRAFSPQLILDSMLSEAHDRLSEFWFWDESPNVLTQAQAIECVPFFDSYHGDDILFHPSDPNRWFILGHETEEVVVVRSFQELCDFYLQGHDGLYPPYKFYRYE